MGLHMKKIILFILLFCSIFYSQSVIHPVEIKTPFVFNKSKPLKEMRGIPVGSISKSWKELIPNKIGFDRNQNRITDNSLQQIDEKNIQTQMGSNSAAAQISTNWDGVNNIDGFLPPDTQGDVGLNHYVQVVNSSFQIWDKNGNSLYGPFALGTIWQDFPGPWETSLNDGDPVVLYDQAADRWLISEFSLPNYPKGPYFELIAISTTPDPTGSWYRYAYEYTDMPDYPKFGIWPDGYYMASNNFFRGAFWNGAGASCFEREEMLIGNPNARLVYIKVKDVPNGIEAENMLPSDWDGTIAPPLGTPNYFTYFNDGSTNDNLRLWEFSVDWNNPSNSTFTLANTFNTNLFNSNVDGIPQPNTSQKLDALADRLMYRLQYRNLGNYEAMVTSHTVTTGNRAAVKWYELRNNGSGWNLFQEGTYAPDNSHRWMSSIALDANGNIALGYSVADTSTYPSIRFTGRLKDDPVGQMTITEQEIITGGGSQTHSSGRWGDYSMMSIDPADDLTFWYTQEYLASTGSAPWRTRIASFSLDSGILADIKIMLEGAYNSSLSNMNTSINGDIPLTSPYPEDPRTVLSIPSNIVDWVLLELRTIENGSAVYSKSVLLRNDGKIVEDDGNSKVSLNVAAGDYYIVVKHRNHLPIMSSGLVSLPN